LAAEKAEADRLEAERLANVETPAQIEARELREREERERLIALKRQ